MGTCNQSVLEAASRLTQLHRKQVMLTFVFFLLSLGLGQGALILSRLAKEEKLGVELKKEGLCGNSSVLYCSRPRHYPKLAIERALRKQRNMLDMFDQLPERQNRVKRDVEDFFDACPSTHDTILPRVGLNTNNQQRFVVNGDISGEFGRLVQLVQVTTCDGRRGESCGAGVLGGRTECRQQYSNHRLVAYDEERGELLVETFRFPSCCSCMVHRTYGL